MGKQQFYCDVCDKSFGQKAHLQRHQGTLAHIDAKRMSKSSKPPDPPNEKKFACHTCDKSYSCLSHLMRHKEISLEHKQAIKKSKNWSKAKDSEQTKGTPNKKYTCQPCGKTFGYSSHLKRHQETSLEHKQAVRSEDNSKKEAKTKKDVSTTKPTEFKCEQCGKHFSSVWNLHRHEKTHQHDIKSNLTITDKEVNSPSKFPIFNFDGGKIPPTNKVFPCKTCCKIFVHASSLTNHEKTHIQKSDLSECEDEEQTTIETNSLKTPAGLFTCKICLKTFSRASSLTNHEKTHTKVENKIEVQPTEGDKNASGAADNQFTCTTCGKHFAKASSLTNHEKTHTGSRKDSTRPSEEMNQVDHREDEEFHTCESCTESFISLPDLRKHAYWNPYSCKRCSKCFHNPKSFELHNALKHGGENVETTCHKCKDFFATRSDLKKHLYWGCNKKT